jgi:hypothetical protein
LIARGLIYGVLAGAMKFSVPYLTARYFVARAKELATSTIILFYVLRYVILGAFVYAFLTHRWGSPLRLLAGISMGLVAFLVLRRMY